MEVVEKRDDKMASNTSASGRKMQEATVSTTSATHSVENKRTSITILVLGDGALRPWSYHDLRWSFLREASYITLYLVLQRQLRRKELLVL